MAALFFALTLFLMTLWRFGANQCLILAVLAVLFTPSMRRQLFSKAYLKQPVFIAIYVFLAWALLTVSYSQASTVWHALEGLKGYAKLLLFLIVPLAIVQEKSRYWVEQGLILGVLINVILSTLYFFHLFVPQLAPHLSMNITFEINPLQLIFVVIIALWILAVRLIERRFAWHDVLIFAILLIYLLLINLERSGYLLFMILALVLAWQYGSKKWFVIVACLLPLLCIVLYFSVPGIKARVNLGVQNVEAFSQVQNINEIGSDNSLGLRLAFAVASFHELRLHPFLGTGIGSFKTVYDRDLNPSPATIVINDPHNAYTYAGFELGLIGLALYVFCLYRLFPCVAKAQGVWWAFVLMGFLDSGLVLNAVALGFIALTGIYLEKES